MGVGRGEYARLCSLRGHSQGTKVKEAYYSQNGLGATLSVYSRKSK
jgi:hypothetical protein